ncbi:MAG: type I-U CRISPR-associated protein Cas5/Cas6 [Myxococcales bacterium 68-20]|nr:MAG: type I-U CRISPR-associated protein Cas5/Cas6 [Myxococcales bacterium 68-20]
MTVLAYRFPGGRYHATPWNAHVNEGLVEWPPSPFRILRALVATGYGRLGWTAIEETARDLFERLSSVLPSYSCPVGTVAHSRHYMPVKGTGTNATTTKVIDAFLRLPTNATLFVRYDVELPDAPRALLASLVRAQPYLGRAEAWVEGELLSRAPDGLHWIVPLSDSSAPGEERVELLASEVPDVYHRWRADFIAREVERREEADRAKAAAKGKTFKGISKSDRAKIEAQLPRDVVDSLLQDTTSLRKDGWSQPPGTRWIGYARPVDALVPRVVTPSRRERTKRPTAALLALSSDSARADVLPPIADAVRRCEALHEALVRRSDPGDGPSPCFTGTGANGQRDTDHRHASLIPLTLGKRKDRLDHVLVYCPMGFDDKAHQALFGIRKTWAGDLPDLFVTLAGLGSVESLRQTVPLMCSARTFRSETAFVPARFLKAKGKDSLLEQVQRELEFRNLPRAANVEVEVIDGRWLPASAVRPGRRASDLILADGNGESSRPSARFRSFLRARAKRPPPVAFGLSLRLAFDTPVEGPILLGYGSHFGLGVFSPEGGM